MSWIKQHRKVIIICGFVLLLFYLYLELAVGVFTDLGS